MELEEVFCHKKELVGLAEGAGLEWSRVLFKAGGKECVGFSDEFQISAGSSKQLLDCGVEMIVLAPRKSCKELVIRVIGLRVLEVN